MKPEKGKKKDKPVQPAKKQGPSKAGSSVTGWFFNIFGAFAALIFITVIFSNVQGYDWLMHTMLKQNFETIEQNPPDLTVPQRYEVKWGGRVGQGEISYVNRIKDQTPDSAIIIMPPRKQITDVGFKSMQEMPWLTYFLYPRKVVYEDDKDSTNSSKLYARANYILALNGWGMNKVNYQIQKPEAFMVLPLKR